jgi:hypothetical protein
MLKRFGAMSRKTMLMLSAVALCALGMGTALALANSGDKDTLNNVNIKEKITAKSTSAVFEAGALSTKCESEGGIETTEANQKLPFTAKVNKPALSFTPCTNGVTVEVKCTPPAEITLTLESGNANRTTDPDPTNDGADESDNDTGTLTLPSGCSIVIKVPFLCTITISGPQTFIGATGAEDEAATLDKASLVFTNVAVTFTGVGGGCPASPGKFSATYAVTPVTLDDLS